MRIITNDPNRVGVWTLERCSGEWFPGRGVALGLEDQNGNLVSGCVFELYNGTNMFLHGASRPYSLNEEFLHACFHFCFIQNPCKRITCVVDESNKICQKFVHKVGWSLETLLQGAGINGGDLLVYRMLSKECKWLTEEEKNGLI